MVHSTTLESLRDQRFCAAAAVANASYSGGLIRLYPRTLGGGVPDLIESAMHFYSEQSGGSAWFFEVFSSRLLTPGPTPEMRDLAR